MEAEFHDVEHFYSDRIKCFDEERQQTTNFIHLVQPEQSELHILHWQERQLTSIISNFRDGHNEQLSKFEEIFRQSKESKSELHAISQNDVSNALMIQQLSEFSQPLQHDTTYFYEDRFVAPNSNDRKSHLSIRNPNESNATSFHSNKKSNSRLLKQVK